METAGEISVQPPPPTTNVVEKQKSGGGGDCISKNSSISTTEKAKMSENRPPAQYQQQHPRQQTFQRSSTGGFVNFGGGGAHQHHYHQNRGRGGGRVMQRYFSQDSARDYFGPNGGRNPHPPPPHPISSKYGGTGATESAGGAGGGIRRYSTEDNNKDKDKGNVNPTPKVSETGGGPPRSSKGSQSSRNRNSLSGSAQNGGSGDFDYNTDDLELDEPFSESEEEESELVEEARRKRQAKPQLLLPMPRRRIRTLSGTIPSVGYSPVWGGPTMCLNCLEFFDLPLHTSLYMEHLLEKHKIVITDIELIVDLKRYVEYWRHRFGKDPIDKVFPLVEPGDKDPLKGKVDKYYLISEKLPEDRQIRERLALRRLDEVLQCQQREREDHTFRRQCLFCRFQTAGNRSKLIHHLYTIHHLNLGSPDNLVFINEYMDVLEGKMKNNECIYCEKKFEDNQVLQEHMRKRQHREVNPKNHYYDKFYVINYLELGKRWLEVLEEDFEDNTPAFIDSDEEEEEETWNEWQEESGPDTDVNAMCLFCEDVFPNSSGLLQHMKEKHKYDFSHVIETEKLDFYDAVKIVNYIRKQGYNLSCFICGAESLRPRSALLEHLQSEDHISSKLEKANWDKEDYLIPTFENDDFLLLLGEIVYGNDEGEGGTSDDEDQQHQQKVVNEKGEKEAAPSSSTVTIIPEDPPDLLDTVLKDADLRDQLQ